MSERTMQALRGRINARLQTSAISRDRASAAGREVVAQCRQSDVETLEWVLSEIDAALATAEPSGEGETMDADAMWYHWSSGHEVAALQGLRAATDDEAHRFLSMLADWQRCPMPSDHDAIAARRGEGGGA